MQDFYRYEPGMKARCLQAADQACRKRVADMLYEARVQAVISFYAGRRIKVTKAEARDMRLTKEEYMTVLY